MPEEKAVKPFVSKVIYHEKNMGKGGALRTGFQAANMRQIISGRMQKKMLSF